MLTTNDHMAGVSERERRCCCSRRTTTIRCRSNAAGEPETETKIQSQKCKQREQGETGERAMRAHLSMLMLLFFCSLASSFKSCIFFFVKFLELSSTQRSTHTGCSCCCCWRCSYYSSSGQMFSEKVAINKTLYSNIIWRFCLFN